MPGALRALAAAERNRRPETGQRGVRRGRAEDNGGAGRRKQRRVGQQISGQRLDGAESAANNPTSAGPPALPAGRSSPALSLFFSLRTTGKRSKPRCRRPQPARPGPDGTAASHGCLSGKSSPSARCKPSDACWRAGQQPRAPWGRGVTMGCGWAEGITGTNPPPGPAAHRQNNAAVCWDSQLHGDGGQTQWQPPLLTCVALRLRSPMSFRTES